MSRDNQIREPAHGIASYSLARRGWCRVFLSFSRKYRLAWYFCRLCTTLNRDKKNILGLRGRLRNRMLWMGNSCIVVDGSEPKLNPQNVPSLSRNIVNSIQIFPRHQSVVQPLSTMIIVISRSEGKTEYFDRYISAPYYRPLDLVFRRSKWQKSITRKINDEIFWNFWNSSKIPRDGSILVRNFPWEFKISRFAWFPFTFPLQA